MVEHRLPKPRVAGSNPVFRSRSVPHKSQIMRFILRFAAVTAILLGACACGENGPDNPVTPNPEIRTLYVSNPYADWTSGEKLTVDGIGNTPVSLDGKVAKLKVSDSDIYHIFYPGTALFDKGTGLYTATLPSTQTYSADGPDRSAMLCCDYAMPGALSFMTASLSDLTGYIRFSLVAEGSLDIKTLDLTARGGEPISGTVILDCIAKTIEASAQGTQNSITLNGRPQRVSTNPDSPTVICIGLIPGLFSDGFDCSLRTSSEKVIQFSFDGERVVEPGQTTDLGSRTVSDPELTTIALKLTDFNSRDWSMVDCVNINGTECHPGSISGSTVQIPVSPAQTYTAAYPADLIKADGDRLAVTVPGLQPYASSASNAIPLLAGRAEGSVVTLSPIYGALRVNMYTAPGVQRRIKKVRLTGSGISGNFSYDPVSGTYSTLRGTADTILVIPEEPLLEEVEGNFTKLRFTMVPGTYSDLKLEVTACDASVLPPGGYTQDDMYSVTTVTLPTLTIPMGNGVRTDVGPTVKAFDWIRANGNQYVGSVTQANSSAAVINTGWIVPEGRGHAVEYECTMSGAVNGYRNERIVFGSQGSGNNKPVFFIYNETNESGWYATMASVPGRDTRLQETGGKNFHIDKALSDRRTVIIGCEGIFNSSYIYAKWRNEKLGQTDWTTLSDKSDYFRFKDGNLRCVYPVFLFANNASGGVKSPTIDIRIHRFIARYDGVAVRDMTPCTVDGIPGMYDSVEKKYYFNDTPMVRIETKAGLLTPFEVGYNADIND